MSKLILICGSVGSGKTTYALSLSKEVGAVRFSIDPWMHTLYSKDMTSLDFDWITERVNRCFEQIWETTVQILALERSVILDLGFTSKAQREIVYERAKGINVAYELHYMEATKEIRKDRIEKRNQEKDPSVYSFEVTDMMFEFMEPRFEVPTEDELKTGIRVNA